MKLFSGSAIFFLIILQQNLLFGQADADSIKQQYPQDALRDAVTYYKSVIDESTALYNGVEYNYRNPDIKGTPFFNENELSSGSIMYDGQLYSGIKMKYDIYKDILITDYYDSHYFFHQLQLIKQKIESFTFQGHNFVHIRPDLLNEGIPSGFYDILYDGGVRVMARYTKVVNKNSGGGSQLFIFARKDFYFLEKNGRMFRIKNKRGILNVLEDKNREIKAFVRKNKIKLKKHPAERLTSIAAYYDKLHEK